MVCVLRVETQAEWDAAVGWLALRFPPNGPSKTRCHDDTTKIPCFDTIAVEIDMCLVRGDQAEWDAAMGWLALRFSPNGPSETRCHDDTSKIPCFDTITVETQVCLVR